MIRTTILILTLGVLLLVTPATASAMDAEPRFRIAHFSIDVTIPLNHRCMGVLPTKSKKIVDRLYAHGFTLLGADKPIVFLAVDWCEIRNGAYDQWRESLAKAANTTRERVLLSSLHQHDAPVTDKDAAQLLTAADLPGELYDEKFHEDAIRRAAEALQQSLADATPVTHLGLGQARVEKIASNRRVVDANGRVTFSRGSRSGASAFHRDASVGEIDPMLKTIRFYHERKPLVALHAYATHPMSYYGQGGVTSDFVGLAREQRFRDDQSVRQIYVSGCSGDVTAGKFNDGSSESRRQLTRRLYEAMVKAETAAHDNRVPLTTVTFRSAQVHLPFHPKKPLSIESLRTELENKDRRVEDRILAAMGLASRMRVLRGQPIDFPCVDFGAAQVVLFPGESFVGYQLMAQKMRPDSFVMSIGYGECWPGYVPTESAFGDGFDDKWLWVGPGSEGKIRAALQKVLTPR